MSLFRLVQSTSVSGLLLMANMSFAQYSGKFDQPSWNGQPYQSAYPQPNYGVISEDTVVTYGNGNQVVNRFVITSRGQLVQFSSVNGMPPQVVELSQSHGEYGTLMQVTAFANSSNMEVFVLNRRGELEQYEWTNYSGWSRIQLTKAINGVRMSMLNNSYLYNGQFFVEGQDRQGRSVRYIWGGMGSGWFWQY